MREFLIYFELILILNFFQGCMDKLVKYLDNNLPLFLLVIAVIVILEILGLILSILMCCAIKRKDHYKA